MSKATINQEPKQSRTKAIKGEKIPRKTQRESPGQGIRAQRESTSQDPNCNRKSPDGKAKGKNRRKMLEWLRMDYFNYKTEFSQTTLQVQSIEYE